MLKIQQDRSQLQFFCLEAAVAYDSTVRVIDAFVDALDLAQLGFVIKGKVNNGAPAFHAADLLKLYFYGYLNRTRSSRRLQREANTNIEAIWLLKGTRPGYKTIANFRKDNSKALKNTFRQFNRFLLGQGLFDQELVAIDGSKFRAQNSKKNNYNEKKIDQHLDYIQRKTDAYLELLQQTDTDEEVSEINEVNNQHIAAQLDHLQQRKQKYEQLKTQVEKAREDGQTQVSTTDPDARALPKKMNIVEVGYNLVTAAETKNNFITNFKLLNENDAYALADIAKDAADLLRPQANASFTVLADKGFDTGQQLQQCAQQHITTIVAPRKRLTNKKNKAFAKNQFIYDEERDDYTCPQGEQLKTNGRWYQKKTYGQHRAVYKFKRYTCSYNICKNCPFKADCVGLPNLKNSKGRHLERSEYAPFIEENTDRYQLNKHLYRKRQTIVEHQFGTIKRQWGFDYTLVKTKEKVAGEFALILSCYNLRRAISILGVAELIKRLKNAKMDVLELIWRFLSRFATLFCPITFCYLLFSSDSKSLKWRNLLAIKYI